MINKKIQAGYDMGKLFVDRHNFKGERALDVGCGHASHTRAFAEKFDRVDAIDITGIRVNSEELKKKKIFFKEMDAHNLDILGDEKYDLIYSLSALEHMKDWKKVVSLISGRLKPGGKFYLVISPLYYSPLGHHLRPEIGDWEHILLPEVELHKKVKESGCPDWRWQLYKELNKLIASEFLEEVDKDFNRDYLKLDIKTIEYLGIKK